MALLVAATGLVAAAALVPEPGDGPAVVVPEVDPERPEVATEAEPGAATRAGLAARRRALLQLRVLLAAREITPR